MKDQQKIKKEIEAIGLRVKVRESGLAVYPTENYYIIFTSELDKLLTIARKYGLRHYIHFAEGFVRLH